MVLLLPGSAAFGACLSPALGTIPNRDNQAIGMFGNRKRRPTRVDSVIGQNTRIVGDVTFAGGLHVDGTVHGNVTAEPDDKATLTLSEHGTIEGEVNVPFVILNGVVKGDVRARDRVELASNARIEGDVHYRLIEMAMGAEVNGKLVRIPEEGRATLALGRVTVTGASADGETVEA
jgi:cytoskeletal protein CcmA (bactofilin family)